MADHDRHEWDTPLDLSQVAFVDPKWEMMSATMTSSWDAADGLRRMLARHVVPPLNDRGYRGQTRKFSRRKGEVVGAMTMQLSTGNTAASKQFTFNLGVRRGGEVVWVERIGSVLPEQIDLWWTVDSEDSIDVVGPHVRSSLTDYGDLALSVVMDDPYPSRVPDDPQSFIQPDLDYRRPIEEVQRERHWWMQIATKAPTWSKEQCLTLVGDERLGTLARNQLERRWPDDPRTIRTFITALATEAEPLRRAAIARRLGFWRDPPLDVQPALSEVARNDEDARVRWAARYALAVTE
jgi:Domain of unknown function (DUF4304)